MSEEQPTPAPPAFPLSNVDDSELEDVYSNVTFVAVGASDVAITFAHQPDPTLGSKINARVRVTMTHANFMEAMRFLDTRYHFMQRVYLNRPPHAFGGDQKVFEKALKDMADEWEKGG